MTALTPIPVLRLYDNSGNLAIGAQVYTYVAGTSTPQATYTDASQTVPNTNPVTANSRGEVVMWLATGLLYKILAKDASGNLLWTADQVAGGDYSANSLRSDLSSTSSGKGADLVGLHLSGAGEVDTTVGPFLNLKVKGLKANFGAAGDGTTDDYAKIANAVTSLGKIIEVETGTFVCNTNLPAPTCAGIVGQNDSVSIIKAGASVTKLLSIGGANYPKVLRDFQLLHTVAVGTTGVYLGDASSIGDIRVQNLRAKGFATGMRVGDVLKAYINAYLELNGINLLVQKTSGGFPTTIHFDSGVCTGATTKGAKIIDANGLIFTNWDFESSGEEGLYCDSSSGSTIEGLVLDTCWFEANYGNSSAQYHARFGTNSGVGTIRPILLHCYFDTNSGGTRAKSMIFDGAEVAGFKLSAPRLASGLAAAIRRQNSAYGEISDWLPYMDYNSVVSEDVAGLDVGVYGYMKDYTPTFASSVGNYGASYSGSPTQTRARYKAQGRTPRVDLNIGLQLIAVTPSWLSVSLPPGWTLRTGADEEAAGRLTVNTTPTPARFVFDSAANLLKIYKADGTNFTSGAAITFGITADIELA